MHNVIIIGSGPAGLTAAIYLARAGLKPLLFAGMEPGGQLMTTTLVENFPGFPKGIQGPELMQNMIAQAQGFGTDVQYKIVEKVDFSSEVKKVFVEGKTYEAQAVLITTGAKSRTLGIPSEKKYWGKGVSTCATCDGAFYRDKIIAVIGGGDTALEEATFLTRFATKVYVIHRRDSFRASKAMQDRLLANKKIEVIWNKEVEEILGDGTVVTGLKLKDTAGGKPSELKLDGMFLAIGHMPNTGIFKDQVELDEQGYIVTKENTLTSVAGVFTAGDVKDHRYRQAITSAGMGCMAALDIEKYLSEKNS